MEPDFLPPPGDIIVTEQRSSEFAGTDLDFRLPQQRVPKAIVIEVLANTCIECRRRFATELGCHVTLVKDATAAFSKAMMHATHELNGQALLVQLSPRRIDRGAARCRNKAVADGCGNWSIR
jgi:nicotinamidase-related amidase